MVAILPAIASAVSPDSLIGIEHETSRRPRNSQSRRIRLIELRKAIESGEYHVPAAALADALLYAARSAN